MPMCEELCHFVTAVVVVVVVVIRESDVCLFSVLNNTTHYCRFDEEIKMIEEILLNLLSSRLL